MTYYTHIAQLKQYANKQTVFMAYLLSMMNFDSETKQNIVAMNPGIKRRIIKSIHSNCKDPLRSANQYLHRLQKSGAIKSIGDGLYLVDPESYGYSGYVPLSLRMKSKAVYCSYVFKGNKITEVHGVIDEDGNKTPMSEIDGENQC